MKVEVSFHGILAELVNSDRITVSDIKDTNGIKKYLEDNYTGVDKYMFRFSVNNSIINDKNVLLKDNDVVKLIPPFPGG